MKYLIFDLEKASCKNNQFKICEFGYVMCDEDFNAIRKGNFIINPNIPDGDWDKYALRKLLYRKKSFYVSQPTFDAFYDEIKALFTQTDYVFGHTVAGDVQGVNDECKRYNLEPINYIFYDIKEFYKVLSGVNEDVGVTRLREILNIEDEYKEHDAESDSYTTMLELKAMLNKYELSLDQLIEKAPRAKDFTKDFVIESYIKKNEIRKEKDRLLAEAIAKGEIGDGTNILFKITRDPRNNKKIFLRFLDNVQVTNPGKGVFEGKKVTISLNYEYGHFRQMMNIVQIIVNEGGTYILKGSEADIYVKYDSFDEEGKPYPCSRLKYVEEANANGKNITIITFDEFLAMIGLKEEELDNMPFPSLDCFLREDAIVKHKHKTHKRKPIIEKKDDNRQDSSNDVHLKQNLGSMFKDIFDKIEKDIDK